MNKAKDYIQLHLNILLFSLTSVFSKAASVQLNREESKSSIICIFISDGCKLWHLRYCMAEGNQKFSLSTAYANRSVYLIWSQIWAVIIFHENLTVKISSAF